MVMLQCTLVLSWLFEIIYDHIVLHMPREAMCWGILNGTFISVFRVIFGIHM